MASRSDQLHSHQFMLQRVVGALAMRDPDPASSPLRRIGGALSASVLIAVLAVAAAGAYGLLRPGPSDAWRANDALVIEEETGARFAYRGGVLHPVPNYSSALLILGAAQPTRVRLPRSALVGVPRGAALGIPAAPDLLPGAGELTNAGWTLCSRTATPTTGAASGAAVEAVLLIGAAVPGTPTGFGTRGLMVRDPTGGLHLLWHSRRYAVTDPDLVLAAFAWPRQDIVPVASAMLNAVPAGADLGRLRVERADRSSPVAGFRLGQVFVVSNSSGGRQFGVALSTGLAEITPVQADLLIAGGANGLGGKPTEMGQAQYATAAKASSLVPTGDTAPPATAPEPVALGAPGSTSPAAFCASFTGGATLPELGLLTPAPRIDDERRAAVASSAAGPSAGSSSVASSSVGPTVGSSPVGSPAIGAATADWIAVPSGRGAVVEALASPGAANGALALVTDLGMRFPVPSRDVLATLGYATVTPLRLPAALVALLPSGPALDPAAATATA